MKATGIVKRVDDLGRIIIPKEIRKRFGICEGTAMEFFVEKDAVVLKNYYIENNLSAIIDNLSAAVDEACDDTNSEIINAVRKHIGEIKTILKNES